MSSTLHPQLPAQIEKHSARVTSSCVGTLDSPTTEKMKQREARIAHWRSSMASSQSTSGRAGSSWREWIHKDHRL
jgi:hypothetical protein